MKKKYSLLNILLATILGLNSLSASADEQHIYLEKQEVSFKKSEYKYIDGKIYYGDVAKSEINQKEDLSIQSISSQQVNYEAIKEVPPKQQLKNDKNINQTVNKDLKRPNEVFFIKGGKPCFEEAAQYHNVDPWLLMSIAYVESRFNPKAVNRNKNGSYDTGMMQINSIWIPTLKKKGIDKSLLNDACASTYIGAWILSDNIRRYGYNWRAIGAYNSGNPKLGLAYAKKVYAAHAKITGIKNKSTK